MGLLYRATTRLMNIGANPGTRSYDFSQNPERQEFEGFLESSAPACRIRALPVGLLVILRNPRPAGRPWTGRNASD
jgi:hypothetical protein